MLISIIPFIISFFLGTIACIGLFYKSISIKSNLQIIDLLFISLLVSPSLVSVLLYYLLFLFPNQSASFYIFTNVGILFSQIILNRNFIFKSILWKTPNAIFMHAKNSIQDLGKVNFLLMLYLCCISILLIIYSSVNDHDWFEYGALGKSFYSSLNIDYNKVRYYPQNGFYFIGLHGFTIPLFKTFEELCNEIFKYKSDFYFRSISYIYNYIFLLWIVLKISKRNKIAAFIFIIILVFNVQAFSVIYALNSIDPIRISLIFVAFYILYQTKGDKWSLEPILFGSLAGIAAFVHSLSMLMMLGMIGVIIISNLYKYRSLHSVVFAIKLIVFFVVFGAGHYLLDLTIGTGWIFQTIKFY